MKHRSGDPDHVDFLERGGGELALHHRHQRQFGQHRADARLLHHAALAVAPDDRELDLAPADDVGAFRRSALLKQDLPAPDPAMLGAEGNQPQLLAVHSLEQGNGPEKRHVVVQCHCGRSFTE